AHGVRAITTSCGFLATFQQELAAAVSVPVLTSSLLQVPLVSRLLRPDQKVGVLTERPHLTERHFRGVGWSPETVPVVVESMPPDAVFPTVFIDNGLESDTDILEREMVEFGCRVARDHSEVGALVLECTNFVPYSQAIRRATGLPVYDLYTLVMWATLGLDGREF
ncbi:MAG: aspartate/glutamate racemase family protein, partial [Chloroflexota bacterium]